MFVVTSVKNGLEQRRLQTRRQEAAATKQARQGEGRDSGNGRNI